MYIYVYPIGKVKISISSNDTIINMNTAINYIAACGYHTKTIPGAYDTSSHIPHRNRMPLDIVKQ